jgi:uncharacterized peroxidase-related enzyme
LVHALASEWKSAPLAAADRELCAFAERVTRAPHEISDADLEALRAHGFDDDQIHDAVQVIAYFNYINRVADALGVHPRLGAGLGDERFLGPEDDVDPIVGAVHG